MAETLKISNGKLNGFLARPTAVDLTDDDPLCLLIPELRGAGEAWRPAPGRTVPRVSLGTLPVAQRAEAAAETSDAQDLESLSRDKSVTVAEALIERQRARGDLPGEILAEVLTNHRGEWTLAAALTAHQAHPFPTAAAVVLAETHPSVLLSCSNEAAEILSRSGSPTFGAALAFRARDLAALREILSLPQQEADWTRLYDLLVGFPLPADLANDDAFAQLLLSTALRIEGAEEAIALRLVACQNSAVLAHHLGGHSQVGTPLVSPEEVVAAALGPSPLSGPGGRLGVLRGAQAMWAGADLTLEHGLARATVAEAGSESTTIDTPSTTYIASPDAIRAFGKTDKTTYTYVHLHLTSAREHHFSGGGVISMPSSLPAIGYRREMATNPNDARGPKVPAIAWPVPLAPAIYSLDTDLGKPDGYFAVADGKTAIVHDF